MKLSKISLLVISVFPSFHVNAAYVETNNDGKYSAQALGTASTAIGYSVTAKGASSFAAGRDSTSVGDNSIAIGRNSYSGGKDSIALGSNTLSSTLGSVAIGNGAKVSANGSVAIGQDSVADRANTFSIGKAGYNRQLVNLAAGSENTDATNVFQLKSVISSLGGGALLNANGVFNGPSFLIQGNKVGTVGDALTALNSGVDNNKANITENSTNIAANTSDIATSKANIATNTADIKKTLGSVGTVVASLGGGASVDANGNVVAPSYNVQGKQVQTVGDALTALNGGVDNNKASIDKHTSDIASNKTSITNITNDLNSGAVGLVKQDATTRALTVAAATGGSAMSIAGTDGNRTLSGVKAGALSAGSNEAVNGAQLFATNRAVNTNETKIATNTSDIAINKTNIANITSELTSGAFGLVKQDANSLALTVAAGTGGTNMSISGANGARILSGVKAGELSAGSNEAVNGSQLFTTNQAVDTNTTDIRANGTKIAANTSDIATSKINIATNTSDIATSKPTSLLMLPTLRKLLAA